MCVQYRSGEHRLVGREVGNAHIVAVVIIDASSGQRLTHGDRSSDK
ncbi:hypothetical protein OH492_28855 [Vibrio chagasii]|nr:hypothetical protein [Vibrio chagasii]